MAKKRISEDDKDLIRTLFVKAYLPCEDIGKRIGCSRQAVAMQLKALGIDASRKKVVVNCSQCDTPTDKTRAEIRKHENHFCSTKCYAEYLKRPEVQDRIQAERVLREQAMMTMPFGDAVGAAFFESPEDVYVFPSREALLEWKRTGLPTTVWSMRQFKNINIPKKEV